MKEGRFEDSSESESENLSSLILERDCRITDSVFNLVWHLVSECDSEDVGGMEHQYSGFEQQFARLELCAETSLRE